MSSGELVPITEYILSHHERWDGTGYPQGLKEDAIIEIRDNSGTQFDPNIVNIFLKLY